MPFLERGPDGFFTLDLSPRQGAGREVEASVVSPPEGVAKADHAKARGLDVALCVLLVTFVGVVLFFKLRARGEERVPPSATGRGSRPLAIDDDEERRAFLAKYGGGRLTS